MPPGGRGKFRVQHVESGDHFGFGVGQQREGDVPLTGKAPDRRDRVVGDRGNAVAERAEIFDALVPGDRLGLAGNSPVERSGKQDDQAAPPRQGFEVAVLAALIRGADRLPHGRADFRSLVERIEIGRHSGRG